MESDNQLNSALSSSVIRSVQTAPSETFTRTKGVIAANAGSDDSSTIGGFMARVYSEAESST